MSAECTGYGILSAGMAVPRHCMSNPELIERHDLRDKRGDPATHAGIVRMSGIFQRYLVQEGVEGTTSLSVDSGRNALLAKGMDPNEIDAVRVATMTADSIMPSTAIGVASELGTYGAGPDVNAACNGFMIALNDMYGALAIGRVRRGLVIGTDVMSRVTDFTDPNTAMLFGDGSGAIILGESEECKKSGLLAVHSEVNTKGANALVCNKDGKIVMDGRKVFDIAVKMAILTCNTLLETAGVNMKDIILVPHQANQRIFTSLVRQTDIELEQIVSVIGRYGNTSAASIPIALHHAIAEGRIERGQLVILLGFGAGMMAVGSLIRY